MVLGGKIHRHRSGLPVVTLDHVGNKVQRHQRVQTGLGEESEPLAVIAAAVDGALPVAEVIHIVDEIDLHAVLPIFQLQNAGILLPPA